MTTPLLGVVKLGFTGHRHDDHLGLIDAKGRIFDPVQKRFLTPDPYVADPLSSQSYHRYSYVTNNPLRYTDPTGFEPAPGDLERRGASSQPDGGAPAATPVMDYPYVLTAATTVVRGRSDDTGPADPPPPPPPITRAEQESKWTELLKHMAWGAAKRLFRMAPPVAMARQMDRSFDIAEMAVKQAANGDWDLAGNTILEIPQDAAESAARILVAPIYAVMAVPAAVRTVMDPQADPEKRGEAAVEALEGIAVVVAAVAGGAAAVKGGKGGKSTTKETGSYTNTHESGKTYSGKGGRERSQASGRRIAQDRGDPHVATDWTPAKNDRQAFKQENRRIQEHRGPRKPNNYNERESPGKRYNEEDGE